MATWSMTVEDVIEDLKRFPKKMVIGYHKPGSPDWHPISPSMLRVEQNGIDCMLSLVIPDYNGKESK